MTTLGRVFLVGAGPGDPDLLTLRAARLLRNAETIVFDRLVSDEVLALASPTARRVYVGKSPGRHVTPQERINEILVELALDGQEVVRLKGGDPFIFGRGSEEAAALRAEGIEVEVVPGVTAAQGAAASAGVPLTHRGLATSVRYVTGHCRADLPLDLDWAGLVDTDTTLVVYMGAATIEGIVRELIAHGMPPELPAMAICAATTPKERRLRTRLGALSADAKRQNFTGPVLFIIGHVASLYEERSVERVLAASKRAMMERAYV